MVQPIRKVAVLGAGVMGQGIAAHLANSGVPSILFDIVPRDLPEGAARSQLAIAGIANASKLKPAAFYRKDLAGGGVLFDLGIYQVSAVVSLFGPAQTVTALCNRRFETRTMDDGTVIQPDVEDSAIVTHLLACVCRQADSEELSGVDVEDACVSRGR